VEDVRRLKLGGGNVDSSKCNWQCYFSSKFHRYRRSEIHAKPKYYRWLST